MKTLDVGVGIVIRGQRVLITRRQAEDSFGGYWEFPGGKREDGESIEQCVVRELWEECELRVMTGQALAVVEHAYPTVKVRLHPFFCRDADEGEPAVKLVCVAEARWVLPGELCGYQFPEANGPLILAVVKELGESSGRERPG